MFGSDTGTTPTYAEYRFFCLWSEIDHRRFAADAVLFRYRGFQTGDLLFENGGNAVLGEVNTRDADAQRLRDFGGRPVFHDVEVEDLELSLVDLVADAFEGLCEKVFLPGSIPFGPEFDHAWIGDALDGGGVVIGGSFAVAVSPSFAELVLDAPLHQVQEPRFEAALGGIVNEMRQPASDANGGFLDDFLGFVGTQTGFGREMADKAPVDSIKILPALRIVSGVQSMQEAGAGFERTAVARLHPDRHNLG